MKDGAEALVGFEHSTDLDTGVRVAWHHDYYQV